jgi:hypothetical protein
MSRRTALFQWCFCCYVSQRYGVQQEDLLTVQLKNTQGRDACAVFSLVLYGMSQDAQLTV